MDIQRPQVCSARTSPSNPAPLAGTRFTSIYLFRYSPETASSAGSAPPQREGMSGAGARQPEDPAACAPLQHDDAVHSSAPERLGPRDALLNASTTSSDAVPQPHDRYRLAFFILYLQGVGCLFPWNAFITKTDYYALAFRGSEYASSFESIVATHADNMYGPAPVLRRVCSRAPEAQGSLPRGPTHGTVPRVPASAVLHVPRTLAPQVTTTFTLLGLVTILCMQRVQHLSSPR